MSRNIEDTKPSQKKVSADAIRGFFRENPDFFKRNKELLKQIEVPHLQNAGPSLIERQVHLLKIENARYKQELKNVMETAKENQRIFDATKKLILSIMSIDSLDSFLSTLTKTLQTAFKIDIATVRLGMTFFDSALKADYQLLQEDIDETFKQFYPISGPYCGDISVELQQFLFGKKSKVIASLAIAPLGEQGEYGVLALGSKDDEQFNETLSTDFLMFITQVISQKLSGFLKKSEEMN